MTQTVSRPATASRPVQAPPIGIVPAAVTSACTAAALGLLAAETMVLLAWASDGRSAVDAVPAAKAGLLGWLLAHGATVSLPDGALSVAPLGLTALLAILLARGGASVVRRTRSTDPIAAVIAGAAIGVPYALLAALVTGPAAFAGARPAPVTTMLAALAVGSTAGAVGGAREVGFDRVFARLPRSVRAVGTAAAVALLVLVSTGALAAGASLAAHSGRAAQLTQDLDVGVAGGVMLLVLSLSLVPTAAVWGAAYALGTGFALGAGTSIAPTGVRLGPVPALPLFAALPGEGPAPSLSILLLAGPIVAGVLAGLAVVRRMPGRSAAAHSAYALVTGPVVGLVTALACVAVSGGLGPGLLAVAGPSPWVTGLAAAEWVGLGAAATAYVVTSRRRAVPG